MTGGGKAGLGPVEVAGELMPWSRGARAGGFVFLSGLVGATDAAGRPVAGIAEQTERALDTGRLWLEEAGASFDDVVKMKTYLASRELRPAFRAARDAWLERHASALFRDNSYASVLVIQTLAQEEWLVEIELTAYTGS
jgi:enamine deaminase RidA (YjgF/YER057c/UK114 family)